MTVAHFSNTGEERGSRLSTEWYPYKEPLRRRFRRSPRYIFSSMLEFLIRVFPLPPRFVTFLHQLRGVKFKDRSTVYIRPLVQLASRFPDDLSIGRNVFFDVCAMVMPDRYVPDSPQHGFQRTRIVIEDNVYIGMGAMILSGVTIHNGAVVAPGSVVYEDVSAYTLVRGNPARVVRALPPMDRGKTARRPDETVKKDGTNGGYDEKGVSRQAFPYEQRFSKVLFHSPLTILRSLLTYAILTLPVPPRLATAMYAWMGIRFKNWKTSGIVLPIFMDPISPEDITIGEFSHISNHSFIASHFFDPFHPGFYYRKAKVTIEDNVFLGMGVIIGAGVRIGSYSAVSARSVVFRDVPNNVAVIGNPARAFAKTPSKTRDYELTVDKDKKFNDQTGKSVEIFHFEHRLSKVFLENPRRIFAFLFDYAASILPLSSFLKASIHRMCGIKIKDPCRIALGSSIYLDRLAPGNLSIGHDVTMQDGVEILAHYIEPSVEGCYYRTGKVTIEDDVFIGANTVIANNVTIGRGAVIMPGTLIVSEVPAYTIIGGFPPEVLGKRKCLATESPKKPEPL